MRAAVAVLAIAVVARAIYAAQVSANPLFQTATIDAAVYYDLARDFTGGHWLSPQNQPYWQPPFYPVVVALWMKIIGPSLGALKTVQMALGAANCVLVFLLGLRLMGRKVGLIAGIAAALYGPMIYFDGELLTPTLQVFLNLSAILVLIEAVERRSMLRFAAAGLLLGFSTITRPDIAVFAGGAVIWTALALRGQWAWVRIAGACGLVIVCAVLPVVPVAVRNAVVGHDRVLISSNGGLNFYIGNNPRDEWTREIRPGPDWDAMQALPMKLNPRAKPSEQSSWFYRESLRWALSHPFSYAGLLLKKAVMYLSAVEGRRNHDLYYYRGDSPFYSALLFKLGAFGFPFGLVLPLAVFGMLLRPRSAASGPLYWYLASQLLVTIAFFVTARYRVPAIPVLLVFAAYGAVQLWDLCRERRTREAIPALAVAACLLVLSNLNLYGIDRNQDRIDADTQLYLAHIHEDRGHISAAVKSYEESIRLKPDYEVSRFELALLLDRMGQGEDAKKRLRECLAIDPRSPAANAKLGDVLSRDGALVDAERHYERAAEADPAFLEKLVPLAEKAYAQGDYALAERALLSVVRKRPGWSEARRSLGVVLMKLDRPDESVVHLRIACNLAPKSAQSWLALGLAYHRLGKEAEATSAFDRALRIGPKGEISAAIRRSLRP